VSPDGDISDIETLDATPHVSVVQPDWSPDGTLHFAADYSGWWNLYRWDGSEAVPIHTTEAEFAHESWVFGLRRFGFLADGSIVAATEGNDGDQLLVLGAESRTIPIPFSTLGGSVEISGGSVFAVGSAFDRPARLVQIDIETGSIDTIQAPPDPEFIPAFASIPEPIAFATPDGEAHALYYPPTHPDYSGPPDELPPAIVTIHGGPTARIGLALSAERLFWTSRGFGVLDVDYGGSTGHGREYRQRLTEQWGVVDVRDCALAAQHLAETGLADADRLVIQGGSAGGFTVLMALALHDVFAAGTARYPVTDLETLAADTHKFESRYLDSLVGPYPATKDRYVDRSPITHVARIDAAVLLLQGLDDRVVPPSQPRAMHQALVEQNVPVGYIEFEGEGHGFRAASTRIRSLEAELSFYAQVFEFEPSGSIAAIAIDGL
jgi:dipeptidyl aminopeptidase/acylaminoacyl peptidase